jgi:hypothetical protein
VVCVPNTDDNGVDDGDGLIELDDDNDTVADKLAV